ncbi:MULTISPECIES: transketolase [unclassified Actinobaculum]|uniref:transketolase n=1 Tax=unclassified Actinobaculum TaxID=2609299 RepID=UPI000D525D59|nr:MULTISPECIES: transketolase [unclassified Actinobaculum]AWE42705.1 transketolase [Actinobaculum sp. 313]RTE49516.1 transketolase [Actinobaculum sp. 352]
MPELQWTDLDQRAVDTGRALAADAVEKAGNGHPGTAISLSPMAYLLFQKVMRHDPSDPAWIGRDRFVLSIGHSSVTLYNQLYFAGYGLELDDLKSLRTEGSLTPGHPEYGHTAGVEMTTGPLGQGLASAVGMAMAARRERGLLDPEAPAGSSPFDHFIYTVVGEGCLEEGVTSEASSLAGTQHLGNLIVIWDDNRISIEDDTCIAFTEDVLARYAAYGWHTQHVDWTNGGHGYTEDVAALAAAIESAQAETDRPSIIRLSTIMAWPSPTKQGTGAAHGAALGAEEIAGLKKALGLNPETSFDVADEVITHTRTQARERAASARAAWQADYEQWRAANPERAALLDRLQAKELPQDWESALPTFETGKSIATRAASGQVLTALAPVLPELWGGSADLAGSNNTTMKGEPSFLPADRVSADWPGNEYGRTLHFGIREHGMAAILNGINLHGLTRSYGGTFFVFADYMRGAVRLAALMHVPSIFVWTHDSIGVGEDGPTHQPIEHLWAYRAIPGLDIVRPADANETAQAWAGILERSEGNPAGLVLSRQGLPVLDEVSADGVRKGGYVLADSPTGTVDVQLLATGSEVQVALAAQETLAAEGIGARVVSLPCLEWFAEQDAEYRDSVILPDVKARVSVEAGSTFGWAGFVGDAGRSIGVDHYGESASGSVLFAKYGITGDAVVAAARESIAAAK